VGKQPQVPDELYAALARHLRGGSATTKNDLRRYLALVKEAGINSGVVDLGCGRGEWLELLKENGIEATGVEANSVLGDEARKKNLAVVSGEAIGYLGGLSEGSLNLVSGFHLLEHLGFAQLVELLNEIRRTLKTGGLVILETPNPKNLVVGACNFYSDPTHRQPLFPETVQFLLSHCGFASVRIEYLHPAAGSPFTSDQAGAKELDTWLFGPRDFAAIASKA
jgi:O-antigen chain-terminating methyltransferase